MTCRHTPGGLSPFPRTGGFLAATIILAQPDAGASIDGVVADGETHRMRYQETCHDPGQIASSVASMAGRLGKRRP